MKQLSICMGLVMATLSPFGWSHPGHAQAGMAHDLMHAAWLLAALLLVLVMLRRRFAGGGVLRNMLTAYRERDAAARLRSRSKR